MRAVIAAHRPGRSWAGVRKCKRCRTRWRRRGCQNYLDAFAYLVTRGGMKAVRCAQRGTGAGQ